MRDSFPTRREVWLAGVLPTFVALIAAMLLLVEGPYHNLRLGGDQSAEGLWFILCLIPFGGAHILGVFPLIDDKPTLGRKILRLGNCAAFLVLFAPAFSLPIALPLAFVEFDFDSEQSSPSFGEQSLLFQALAFLVTFAVFAAPAISCGGLLALTARPRWSTLSLMDLKRLLLFYIVGSVLAALILVALTLYFAFDFLRDGHVINPLFDADRAWPITLMTYEAVVLACGGIWMAAFQLYSKSGNVLKSRECRLGLASLVGAAVVLVAVTQLMAANDTTLLNHKADGASSPHDFANPLESHGFYFIGPKSALMRTRDGLLLQSGEWAPQHGTSDGIIEVGVTTAEDQRPPDCRALSETRTVCADLKRDSITAEQLRPSNCRALSDKGMPCTDSKPVDLSDLRAVIDVYEYDASLPEAALSYAHGAQTATATIADLQAVQAEQGSRCHLQLVGVPFDGLTTKAMIGCADWLHEARRLKELVTPWFTKTPK